MVPADERDQRIMDFIRRLRWKGPVFPISALTREGCEPLVRAAYGHVAAQAVSHEEPDPRFQVTQEGAGRE
jgi:GTPase